jgi:DNA-binding transcriptional LysR family regulator
MRVDASGPPIEDLRTFLLLVDLGGVADVAHRLGVDVSVVSRRLRPFRERYGLLRKQGGSLVLTERGRDVVPSIRALLHAYDDLAGLLSSRKSESPVLTIAVGGFGSVKLVPEVVARFTDRHPTWEVRGHVCRGRERILGVTDGRFDLAVVSHSLEQIRSLLGGQPVAVEPLPAKPFAVVARRSTPAGDALAAVPAGGVVSIRDLAEVSLVGLDEASGVRTQLERQAADAGVRLRFGTAVGGWLAAREYARHGLGVGIVPFEILADADVGELLVRVLARPLWPCDHLLSRRTDAARTDPLKQVLIETAADQARRQHIRIAQLTD